VEGLGGQIEVENGPASGATVRMSLPALP